MNEQLSLFSDEELRPQRPKPRGTKSNVAYYDYESFLAKFADNPKTTDDCFTPKDVYEAVVQYVGTIVDLSDKQILRPFFPGGDYEHADYPDNGIVIDNPPFSLFLKIVKFYVAHQIPFFLFGNGLTIGNCYPYCTAVVIDQNIIFENGAKVQCNFASNLFGDKIAMTAPALSRLIAVCPSQEAKESLPQFKYPDELLTISELQYMARGGVEFSVERSQAHPVRYLDGLPPGKILFGRQIFLSKECAKAKESAKQLAMSAIEEADKEIVVELSDRERRIVERLNGER